MTGSLVRPPMAGIQRPALAPRGPAAVVDTAHPVVQALGFRFSYGDNEVLKGIDLPIAPRAITAIIGPSGCGKSTFLLSLIHI